MNIYELNALIKQLENEKKEINIPIIEFYKEKRKELMATLSKGINKILKEG